MLTANESEKITVNNYKIDLAYKSKLQFDLFNSQNSLPN